MLPFKYNSFYKVIPHLKPQWKKIVKSIIKKYPHHIFFVYGSRSRDDFREYSDLDLCIHSKFKSLTERAEIRAAFSESNLPISVDLIAWDEISTAFQKEIEDDLIILD
jgi:predicted nucleotidyltransferase